MMLGLGGIEPVIVLVILALLFFFGKGKAMEWIRDVKDVASSAEVEENDGSKKPEN